MQGLNRVTLIGNLGQDPELRHTQSTGQAVLSLRLATNESWVDRDGERKERTEWHTVILWGKRAEALNKLLSKGSAVAVEGRLQTRQWEDRSGNRRYTTEIVGSNVILLGDGKGGGDRRRERAGDDFGDDDIPF